MNPIDQLNITQFLFQLVLLVVSLSTPIIVTAIVKYLQARVGNENLKKYIEYAKTAVQAAESIYTESGQGVIKKSDVEIYLSEKIGKALSPEDIDKLIQAAVYEINKTSKKLIYEVEDDMEDTQEEVEYSCDDGCTNCQGGECCNCEEE